jgi:hypothetical protein
MPNLGVYFDDATAEGIERYQRRFIRDRKTPPSRSEIVRLAVAEYLAKQHLALIDKDKRR